MDRVMGSCDDSIWWMPSSAASVSNTSLFAVGLVLAVWAVLHWRQHAIGSHKVPPGVAVCPGAVPLLGNTLVVLRHRHRLHDWLADTTDAFKGRTWAFTLPCLPTFFICSDPNSLEYVLKQRMDNFVKGAGFAKNLGPVLGHGIFVSDGARWKAHRKLAANIFSVRSFKEHVSHTFAQRMDCLTARLDAAAESGQVVDLMDLLYRYTMDVFARVGFGVELGCLSGGAQSQEAAAFSQAFDASIKTCNLRWWLPLWPIVEKLTGSGTKLRANIATVRHFAAGLIQARRDALAHEASAEIGAGRGGSFDYEHACGGGSSSPDLLALFMGAIGPDGKPLSDGELADHVINFIIAGRDTTGQALAWSLYNIISNPETEQAILREAAAVLHTTRHTVSKPASNVKSGNTAAEGADLNNQVDADAAAEAPTAGDAVFDKPEYEQLKQLRYTHAAFLESLRLCPSVPLDCKFGLTDDQLPDGTFMPAGAMLVYAAYVNGHSKAIWGEDAHKYRPERWLQMAAYPSPYRYLSFNAGPRLCLGKALAELEGVYVLAGLLQRYKLRLLPGAGNEVTYVLSTTLAMKNGFKVLVERRTGKE